MANTKIPAELSSTPSIVDNGNATAITIDSSENVGIGTDSITNALDINGSQVLLANGALKFADAGNAHIGMIKNSGSSGTGQLEFYTGSAPTERMRISSNGNVGISTTSPSTKLEVNGDGLQVRLDGTANTSRGILLRNTGTAEGQIQTDGNMHFIQEDAGKYMRFSTANTERMRLNESGNLLVGKTEDGTSNAGHVFFGAGAAYHIRSNGFTNYFNRTSSDGEILRFAIDGSQLASIGIQSSTLQVGTGNTQLAFADADDAFFVKNQAGANRDNSHDLGKSSARFKDLYLGGGVHLGGTSTANKLDDYEEGTWTPNLGNSANINSLNLTEAGRYVKVGNLVHVEFDVTGSFVNAAVESRFSFSLPFNTATTSSRATGMFSHLLTSFSNGRFNNGQVFQGTTQSSSLFVYISTNQLSGTGNFNGRATVSYASA